jgi:hypothetical protein
MFNWQRIIVWVSLVLAFVLSSLWAQDFAWCAISSSHVLVLYNADWDEDAPLTGPGQDSKEIADHYVRMHTDPVTGEKPYLLGLTCRHGNRLAGPARHLDEAHLAEDSDDNTAGVELTKWRWLSGVEETDQTLRDSRFVEFTLPGGQNGWRVNTLQMEIKPDDRSKIRVVQDGQIAVQGQIAFNRGKGWTLRLDGKSFTAGSMAVHASCENNEGKRHEWQARYVDIDDVKFSRTGRDGVRDDRNFLEDVALPVKAFLEDPANARPDGTLLRDHVLFIVICYGLPRTANATYGISRGVTEITGDHGAIIDFGQRLQLLYYDEEKVMGAAPKPHRFAGKGAFSDFFLRAPQAWPLYGATANPFAHPLAYGKKGGFDQLPEPLGFQPSSRGKFLDRHLYFVMRIDGETPQQTRGLIDRAVYASKHAGPAMGPTAVDEYARSKERVAKLESSKVGKWLWEKGWRRIYYGGAARDRLELLRLPLGAPFFNTEPVYLPGGVGGTVISHNGWKKGEMLQDLARGVTATIGAAKVYRGAPHIHDKSWWDDEIFYPFLVRGKTLGEALLMNQVHLGWIATFIGDPLYRLPQGVLEAADAPGFNPERDVKVCIKKSEVQEVWLIVDLGSTPAAPKVAQMRAISEDGREAVCRTFEAKPYVKLGDAKDVCGERWRVEVVDPFGKRFGKDVVVDCTP